MIGALELPRDSEGFVRRQCPHCARPFKTRPFPTDGRALHRHVLSRLAHANGHEGDSVALRACAYCGKWAVLEAWLTPEQRLFLDEQARALRDQVRYQALLYVLRTLSKNPRPTYVVVPPKTRRSAMAPEPDDLSKVLLLCCADEVKVLPGWEGSIFCPRCGAVQRKALEVGEVK